MLANRQMLYGVLLVGIVLVALAFAIDPIRGEDFYMSGWQWLVLAVGAVLTLAGVYLAFMRKPPAVR